MLPSSVCIGEPLRRLQCGWRADGCRFRLLSDEVRRWLPVACTIRGFAPRTSLSLGVRMRLVTIELAGHFTSPPGLRAFDEPDRPTREDARGRARRCVR